MRSQSRKVQKQEKKPNWRKEGPWSWANVEKGQTSGPDVSWMCKKTGSKPTWKEVAPRGADSNAY